MIDCVFCNGRGVIGIPGAPCPHCRTLGNPETDLFLARTKITSQQSEIDRLTRELAEREKQADAYLAFKDKALDHGCDSLTAVFKKLRQLEAAQSASSQPGSGGEPVAWKHPASKTFLTDVDFRFAGNDPDCWIPLYASPQQRLAELERIAILAADLKQLGLINEYGELVEAIDALSAQEVKS